MTREALAVYDVRDDQWRDRPGEEHAALADWLRDQGIDPEESLRVEIHQGETLFARVTQFVRDADGNRKVDYKLNVFERSEPFDVPVSCVPPTASAGLSTCETRPDLGQ